MTSRAATETTTNRANTELVLRFIAEVWNRSDPQAAAAFLSDDYVDHAYQPPNRDGLAQTIRELCAGLPDQHSSVEAHIAEGDLVVVRLTLRGTHQGLLRGHPATGNPVQVTVYRTYRVADGRIAEHWALLDTLSLFRQLGAAPVAGPVCAR